MHRLHTGLGCAVALILLAVSTGTASGQAEEPARPVLEPTDDQAVLEAVFLPHEEWMGEPRQLVYGPDGTLWLWDGAELWQAGSPDSRVSTLPFRDVYDLVVALDDTLWVASRTGLYSLTGGTWGRDWAGAVYGLEIAADGTLLAVGGGMRGDPEHDDFSLISIDANRRAVVPIEGIAPVAWPSGIAAPRDGGVWIAALNPGWGFVGLAFEEGILLRYDGETWLSMQPLDGTSALGVPGLAVGPDGSLWALLRTPTEQDRTEPHLARLQGGDWTAYPSGDDLPQDIGLRVGSLAVDGEGRVWTAPGAHDDAHGIAVFDGQTWSRYLPGTLISDNTIGPDGSIWTAGSGGIHVVRPEAAAATE